MRPSCGDKVPPGKHIGALCATNVPSDGPTLSCAGGGTATAVLPARTSDPSAAQSARFLPGTVIAERYRIVAQVGRGGMGEVYRADDLRLGQTVALKFLPESLSRDPAAVGRLNREVRMARQVSHPNVCRVFDVAEADGVQFISMEFVDGEDLGSLLQRIGRLPHDKAVQVAHQLCAGLAAAHAFGVLHRDLKPANIMLDGRGNVRITDFGLAITAEELTGEDEWAGTPAYMAPEQLAGQTATTQSDLYALGLVLYQLFSGKEAYPASTITEMLARRQKGAPVKISSVVKGMDVVIERAIFQCLECDPQSRPRSALVVAAALPGGDPLAAAVAAGETPSPEMVAGAIDEPLVSVGRLWLMAVAIVFGIAVFGMLVQRGTVLGLAPVDKRGEVMAERARQVLDRVGYTGRPADSVYWFVVDQDYVEYRAARGRTPEQAKQWKSATPAPVQFVYRQSPRPLTPLGRRVTQTDPASDIGGMATVILDTAGRLQYLSVVPHQSERLLVSSEPDWTPLLTQAELDPQTPSSTAPRWLPPIGFDQRRAWDGNLGGTPVHVVAAS